MINLLIRWQTLSSPKKSNPAGRKIPIIQRCLQTVANVRKKTGLVSCTCNPATLEAEFQNSVGSVTVGSDIPLIGGWIV